MSKRAIIKTQTLDTAEELFRELSPATGSLYKPDIASAEWIFRGQCNDANGTIWTLTPSAWRPDCFLPFIPAATGPLKQLNASDQRYEEIDQVLKFASMVDRHGLQVPDDHPELRSRRVTDKSFSVQRYLDWREFPAVKLSAMVGLAQHYGVPTRFLDWTWKPYVAAYFAAQPVATRREPGQPPPAVGEAPFSVFALRKDVGDALLGLDTEVHVISVPTANNPNLHAQGGVFTLVQPKKFDQHPLPRIDEVLSHHEAEIRERDQGKFAHKFPYLIEFRIPATQARTTLMLLSHLNVSGASIYPGLSGAVRALREHRYHQWADANGRS